MVTAQLKELILRIVNNGMMLKTLYEVVEKSNASPDSVRLLTPLEDMQEQTRKTVLAWSRAKGCPVGDVPIIPALEALHDELRAEIQRTAFRGKENILAGTGAKGRDFLEKVIDGIQVKSDDLADYLEAELYAHLPEMLRRASRVHPLVLAKEVPAGLALRYREAVRSYVSGNPIACCVLCRAVLEVTLKEEWDRRFPGRLNSDRFDLAEIIDNWEKKQTLSPDLVKLCRKIKDNGNDAVHRDALPKPNDALESLNAIRRALKDLIT
jgi:Domain of unknown function (DUF4145)